MGCDADIIQFGLILENNVLCPHGCLVPLHPIFTHGDDIDFAVAIHIGFGHGITDGADPGIDRLFNKLGTSRR